ncbi:MAG: methylated-DNA--[protein]-cysteine S-methyltransferase [Anaerolineaceae bacterium]
MAYIENENIGPLEVYATAKGICKCEFCSLGDFERSLLTQDECLDVSAAQILSNAVSQINAYLLGKLTNFDLPIDWEGISPFAREVYQATMEIPFGEVRTYGEIALAIKNPEASRAVGQALGANPIALIVPCHRVVGHNKYLHGFSAPGGLGTKSWLLQHEGHRIRENRLV